MFHTSRVCIPVAPTTLPFSVRTRAPRATSKPTHGQAAQKLPTALHAGLCPATTLGLRAVLHGDGCRPDTARRAARAGCCPVRAIPAEHHARPSHPWIHGLRKLGRPAHRDLAVAVHGEPRPPSVCAAAGLAALHASCADGLRCSPVTGRPCTSCHQHARAVARTTHLNKRQGEPAAT